MSLALSTLLYEWRRYMAAMIALALAGVLMLAMTGLFIGILQSFTATIDRSRGQIIVMSADSGSMNGPGGSIPKRVMPLIYRHPEVVEVADLPGDFGQMFGPGATEPDMVNVMVIDTAPNSVTLPVDIDDTTRQSLGIPFNVAVDRSALRQLGVKLGDEASLNGRTVRIAKVLNDYANANLPNVIMSRQTQRLMGRANDDQLGTLMVRIKNPADAEKVRDELNKMADDQYRAWTKTELSRETVKSAMSTGILALIVGFMSVIGFVIGVAITWQTLRGAILANVKEFASLRALGVSIASLRWVVMELSFWVGIVGILMSGVLMAAITVLAKANNVPMGFQIPSLVQTALLLLMIAIGSGALTLGALKKGEPADLLK